MPRIKKIVDMQHQINRHSSIVRILSILSVLLSVLSPIQAKVTLNPDGSLNLSQIPDPNFRECVSQYAVDGVIPAVELRSIGSLVMTDKGIESLEGIEFFTGLGMLSVSQNKLSDIDVSALKRLYSLGCSDNLIKSIDVSKNENLEKLFCSGNQLTELNLADNHKMQYFSCARNLLTSVTLSDKAPYWGNIDIYSNKLGQEALYNIVSTLQEPSQQPARLHVYDKSDPNEENVWTRDLSAALMAKGWTPCTKYDDNFPGILPHDPALDIVIEESFTDAEFRKFLLDTEYGKDGIITNVEIDQVTELAIQHKNIASLEGIRYFSNLQKLYCQNNELTALDLTGLTDLTWLSCENNRISTLSIVGCSSLEYVRCYANRLDEQAMQAVVDALPTFNSSKAGQIEVYDVNMPPEANNICTIDQVAQLKAKGWKALKAFGNGNYEGVDPAGIDDISPERQIKAIYDILGHRIDKQPSKGIFVIHYNDGTIKKRIF